MTFRKLAAVALIFVGSVGGLDDSRLVGPGPDRAVRRPAGARGAACCGAARTGKRRLTRGSSAPAPTPRSRRPSPPTDGSPSARSPSRWCGRVPVGMDSTRATADLDLEHRRKGLLWYATYTVAFKGTYTFRNPDAVERVMGVRLPLPAENALFDDFVFSVNGQPAALAGDVSKEMIGHRDRGAGRGGHTGRRLPVARARDMDLRVRPRQQRRRRRQVRDFQLAVDTNVVDIDFPAGSMSPNQRTPTADGWRVQWTVQQPAVGPGDRRDAAREAEPGPVRGPRHVLRAGRPAVLPRGDGDPGRDLGPVAAPDALLVRRRRILRLPPAAGLSGGPRLGARGLRASRRR